MSAASDQPEPRSRRSSEVFVLTCYKCHREVSLPVTGDHGRCYHGGAWLIVEWRPR